MKTKLCTRCGETKSVDCFYLYKKRNVYRSNCRDCYNEWSREYGKRDDVKERRNEKYKKRGNKNLIGWAKYIPSETDCAICGIKIVFNSKSINKSIHFDHTKEVCAIMTSPMDWLIKHRCTDENKDTWDSCNFGMLCGVCNRALPTKNRKEWLKKAMDYADTI